jgi:hypothetical protein
MIRAKKFPLFALLTFFLMSSSSCRAALPENFIELSDDV